MGNIITLHQILSNKWFSNKIVAWPLSSKLGSSGWAIRLSHSGSAAQGTHKDLVHEVLTVNHSHLYWQVLQRTAYRTHYTRTLTAATVKASIDEPPKIQTPMMPPVSTPYQVLIQFQLLTPKIWESFNLKKFEPLASALYLTALG